MADVMDTYPTRSRESELDALIDAMIAKVMAGEATDKDRIEYQELLAARTRRMRPPGLHPRWPASLRRTYA